MPAFSDARPELKPEQFRLLRELVREACGISIRDEMKFVMERRLGPRLEALGLTDFEAYYRFLRYAPERKAELELAIEALTTNETYFFREQHQLDAFSEELLPRLEQQNARLKRLRIWSAGCSTGEEPYTIAMLLLESGRFAGWQLEVHGTDISKRVLAIARRGEYGPSALRSTSLHFQRKYFEAVAGKVRVKDEVRSLVTFAQLNLLDPGARELAPRCDLVFCRNVMIYFDLPARKQLLATLHDRLYEGGYLLLGHSENLIQVTADFELVHLQHDLVYRRPGRGGEP